jgi:peptidyl-prolyl cis-trans isomerase SDCCAG10
MYINEPRTSGKVCLVTTLGDIDIELWSKECPLATRNFVQLCMEGYYDGTIFHRLQKDFMVQGGDPTGTGESNDSIYDEPFKSEFHQRLQFNRRGLLGCAGTKDENGSQFFFTLGSTPELYKKHTMFGKVTGNTVFNLMRFNDHDIDKNERPVPEQKILKVKILENPFKDIKPRIREEVKKPEKSSKEKNEKKPNVVKNTALLSFGDEVEEDEEELTKINKDLAKKGKSAHDVLNDQKLSKTVAVNPEEFSNYEKPSKNDNADDDNQGKEERIKKVREKLQKRKIVEKNEEAIDEDFQDAMVAEKRRRIDEEKQKLTEQLNELQKEYAKSLRGPKAQNDEDDEPQSEAMKNYSNMKLKFKKDMKGIVKHTDPSREAQTMKMFEMIKNKISKPKEAEVKVETEDPLPSEVLEVAASNKAVIEENAEDEVGETWMSKKFNAPEDISGVTKARDANMKEQDEEWYPIGDPRNKMAQRRRDGALDEV